MRPFFKLSQAAFRTFLVRLHAVLGSFQASFRLFQAVSASSNILKMSEVEGLQRSAGVGGGRRKTVQGPLELAEIGGD